MLSAVSTILAGSEVGGAAVPDATGFKFLRFEMKRVGAAKFSLIAAADGQAAEAVTHKFVALGSDALPANLQPPLSAATAALSPLLVAALPPAAISGVDDLVRFQTYVAEFARLSALIARCRQEATAKTEALNALDERFASNRYALPADVAARAASQSPTISQLTQDFKQELLRDLQLEPAVEIGAPSLQQQVETLTRQTTIHFNLASAASGAAPSAAESDLVRQIQSQPLTAADAAPTIFVARLDEYFPSLFASNDEFAAFIRQNQVHLLPVGTSEAAATALVMQGAGRAPDFVFSSLALKRADGNKIVLTDAATKATRKFLTADAAEARRLAAYVGRFASYLQSLAKHK